MSGEIVDEKKQYHDSNGRFTDKKNATSISYGHYDKENGGKFQYKNGPKIAKHKAGSRYTKKGSGGRGQHKYRLKDKTAKWEENLKAELNELEKSPDRLGTELRAVLTKIQRLEDELAKYQYKKDWLQAEISILNEEPEEIHPVDDLTDSAQHKRALELAGLSDPLIEQFLKTKGSN